MSLDAPLSSANSFHDRQCLTLAPYLFASDPVETIVNSYLNAHQVPGAAVAVIRDGRVIEEVISGSANVQLGVPVQRTTVFQLASVTKIFTAVTLVQLEQEGKLHLEDPISRYLTGLPKAWDKDLISGESFFQSEGSICHKSYLAVHPLPDAAASSSVATAGAGTSKS